MNYLDSARPLFGGSRGSAVIGRRAAERDYLFRFHWKRKSKKSSRRFYTWSCSFTADPQLFKAFTMAFNKGPAYGLSAEVKSKVGGRFSPK